jgi:hypothetical protein
MPVSMSMLWRCSSLAARVTRSVCSTQPMVLSRKRINPTNTTAPNTPPIRGSLMLRLSSRSKSSGSIAVGVFIGRICKQNLSSFADKCRRPCRRRPRSRERRIRPDGSEDWGSLCQASGRPRYTVISYSPSQMGPEPSSPRQTRPALLRTSFPSRPCAPSARRRATSTCASCPRPARSRAWPAMRWCSTGAATATRAKWGSTPPAARCGCAAGPTATSREGTARRRNQDLPRRLRRHPRQPPRAALGPGPHLRLDAVRAERPRPP